MTYSKEVPPRPPVVIPPTPPRKTVVGYQHLKGSCEGSGFYKVQQQWGGRGMWHGIYCVVNYSDGTSQRFDGKVDFSIDGVQVCERSAKPRNFNCVSSCDYTNGPFVRK